MEGLKTNLAFLLSQMSQFEEKIKKFNFNDPENREEALDEINSAIISLDEIEDILDRDAELAEINKVLQNEN